jgi:hypothetical protein
MSTSCETHPLLPPLSRLVIATTLHKTFHCSSSAESIAATFLLFNQEYPYRAILMSGSGSGSKRRRNLSPSEQSSGRPAPARRFQIPGLEEKSLADKLSYLKAQIADYCKLLHDHEVENSSQSFTATHIRNTFHTQSNSFMGTLRLQGIEAVVDSIKSDSGADDEVKRTADTQYDNAFFAYHDLWISNWRKAGDNANLSNVIASRYWWHYHDLTQRIASRCKDLANAHDAESVSAKGRLLSERMKIRKELGERVRATSKYYSDLYITRTYEKYAIETPIPVEFLENSQDPVTDAIFFHEFVAYHRDELRKCTDKSYGVRTLRKDYELIRNNLSGLNCTRNDCDKSMRCDIRQAKFLLEDDLKAFDMEADLHKARIHYHGKNGRSGRQAAESLRSLETQRKKLLSEHFQNVYEEALAYWKELSAQKINEPEKWMESALKKEKNSFTVDFKEMKKQAREKHGWFQDWVEDASATHQRLKSAGDVEAVRVAVLTMQRDCSKVEHAYIDYLREIQSRMDDCGVILAELEQWYPTAS